MDRKQHARVSAIFADACELPEEQREAFLEQSCAGDPALRAEVDSLLDFDVQASRALDTTGVRRRLNRLLERASPARKSSGQPTHIGSYKILHLLGEGGQGRVYAAEQHTPRRTVALKVLAGGSFAGRHDVSRFKREIQALASLCHPGIATIYDAGCTEEGQHFLAMEFAPGIRLDRYARDNRLSIQDRLILFCKVCDAIDHAHSHGIIHRDLKPSNVLVDEDGNPKVLDFGLVRMTDSDVTLASTDLSSRQVMGSLPYMSPEQARGCVAELGAATDVYSLGVVLYVLLTARLPYEVSAYLPEAVQTICEVRPTRPGEIDRSLRGDLETIVLKALEKDPTQRYATPAELAADVRRYLTRDPIRARRPGPLYSARVMVRKHPSLTGAIAALTLLTLTAIGVGREIRQQNVARARRLAAEIQRRLEIEPAERLLGEAQSLYDRFPRLPVTRLVLAQARMRASQRFQNPTLEGEALVLMTDGVRTDPRQQAFRLLLAELHRSTGHPDAEPAAAPRMEGSSGTAEASYLNSFATLDLRAAARFARQAVETDPSHTLALARLAHLCDRIGDFDCAMDAAGTMAALGDRFYWTRFRGDVRMRQGRYRDALQIYDTLSTSDSDPDAILEEQRNSALAYLCLEDHARAAELWSKVLERFPRVGIWNRYKRATVWWILGRLDDAAEDYRQFRRVQGQAFYADARLFLLDHDRAQRYESENRWTEAEAARSEAAAVLRSARKGVRQESWLDKIFDCLAGELAPDELILAADPASPQEQCEGYFYAAEFHRVHGETDRALEMYRNCVATNVVFDPDLYTLEPMNEYHLARWRLRQLGDEP